MKLEFYFYRNENGSEPVKNWLRDLSQQDKKIIGEHIKTVQFGWPVGMPLVDSLGDGLWEVRTRLSGKRIARIIFFLDENRMILVNSFFKKTQKTPKLELEKAKNRKKSYQLNEGE